MWKQYQCAFPNDRETWGTTLLGLVHFDVCEPTQTQGGVWYFALFIDDISRYTQACFIKKIHKYYKKKSSL
jgi:hypothetical protein